MRQDFIQESRNVIPPELQTPVQGGIRHSPSALLDAREMQTPLSSAYSRGLHSPADQYYSTPVNQVPAKAFNTTTSESNHGATSTQDVQPTNPVRKCHRCTTLFSCHAKRENYRMKPHGQSPSSSRALFDAISHQDYRH